MTGRPGDGIESVFADGLIKSVRKIDAANVAAAKPAKIADANAVRERTASGALIDDIANRCGANEKAVVVVVNARIIFVPRTNEFRGVTGKEKILKIDISQHNLLVTAIKSVETAVGIFFEELKIRGVVFDAVAVPIAKDAQAGLFVNKEKSAEIGIELLNARTRAETKS